MNILKQIQYLFDKDQKYADQLQKEDEQRMYKGYIEEEQQNNDYRHQVEKAMFEYLQRAPNDDKVKIYHDISLNTTLGSEFRYNNFNDNDKYLK